MSIVAPDPIFKELGSDEACVELLAPTPVLLGLLLHQLPADKWRNLVFGLLPSNLAISNRLSSENT
jgi:hypothetical protein